MKGIRGKLFCRNEIFRVRNGGECWGLGCKIRYSPPSSSQGSHRSAWLPKKRVGMGCQRCCRQGLIICEAGGKRDAFPPIVSFRMFSVFCWHTSCLCWEGRESGREMILDQHANLVLIGRSQPWATPFAADRQGQRSLPVVWERGLSRRSIKSLIIHDIPAIPGRNHPGWRSAQRSAPLLGHPSAPAPRTGGIRPPRGM